MGYPVTAFLTLEIRQAAPTGRATTPSPTHLADDPRGARGAHDHRRRRHVVPHRGPVQRRPAAGHRPGASTADGVVRSSTVIALATQIARGCSRWCGRPPDWCDGWGHAGQSRRQLAPALLPTRDHLPMPTRRTALRGLAALATAGLTAALGLAAPAAAGADELPLSITDQAIQTTSRSAIHPRGARSGPGRRWSPTRRPARCSGARRRSRPSCPPRTPRSSPRSTP